MADIRRRGPTRSNDGKPTFANGSRIQEIHSDEDETGDEGVGKDDKVEYKTRGVRFTDILRVLGGIMLLNFALSYFVTGNSLLWGYSPWWSRWGVVRVKLLGPVSLTDEQLSAYDGTDPTLPIYVGLNGQIYDVSAAKQTYGPDGSYGFFSGRDSARAFLTGCFKDDLTGDLRGVETMYMPADLDTQPQDMPRGQWKIKREQDRRSAMKQVNDGIEGWAKVLRGDTGRPYFWVGSILREKDHWEKQEMPILCDAAVEARPKRKEGE